MTALYCITWAVIAGVAAWAATTTRACAAIARLREQMRADIGYWQDEASRARAHAAQIVRETAIWADAWKQGRDDAIAIMPLIIAARGAGSGAQDAASEEPGPR